MESNFIDAYCERIGPYFWAEPINAITNLGFIVAGLALTLELSQARRQTKGDTPNWILVWLIFAIGIGSFLFHTFAALWAALADTIPIGLFILTYTYLAMTRLIGLPIWGGILGVLVVLALAIGPPALFDLSSGPYLAALVSMAAIGLYLTLARRHPAGTQLLSAAVIFAVSLTLRTLDGPLCGPWPVGTHFFWHLLNAIVLYLITRAMIRHGGQNQI